MKKWSLLWIIFLFACSNEYLIEPEPPIPPAVDEQEVSIKITFPGSGQVKTKSPSTYAISEDEENTVSSLDIFAFASGEDVTSPSTDVFLYRVTVREDKIANVDASGTTKTVVASLKRLPQEQRFIFVANLPSTTSLDNLTEGETTKQEIVDQLKFDGSPWRSAQASGKNNYTPIPMWGQLNTFKLINSASSLDLGTVYLVRSMAKIEVSVAAGLTDYFTIKNISVCNSSDTGYIAPNKDEWDKQIITKTNPVPTRVSDPVEYEFPSTPDSRVMERTIYVPETDTLLAGATKPTYLVIHAEYKSDGVNVKDNYYRVDFTKEKHLEPLLRNHGYLINIIGAKEGYQTFDEARNAPVSDFDFSLTLDESKNINEVIYLGNQYMLGIEVSEVLFDWDMTRIGRLPGETAHFPLHVLTTYPGGWTAELLNASTWVNLEGKTSGGTNKVDSITINVGAVNRTGAERNDTLIIRAGMLVKKVAIRQSGGANSRIIRFNAGENTATTRIPLAFANAANVARGGKSFSDISTDPLAFDAKIIWQEAGAGQSTITVKLDGTGDIKDRDLVVTAQAGMKRSGNAVVAIVKKGSGIHFVGGADDDEVLWSWHIWCMNDDYMEKDYHNPNVPLFMKRALGWYQDPDNQGMFYQWGRKDPFPKALTGVSPMDVANLPVKDADNLSNAIKNPATFYTIGASYLYWTGSSAPASGLWQKTKTYNDPCPVGWRVPDADKDKNYWTAGVADYYPKGYLSEGTGNLTGNSGSFWTLTAGTVFELSGSGIGTGSSNSSAGRPVRCIKDIQLIKTSL